MRPLKSSLVVVASMAILGCPSTPAEPEPDPDPIPVEEVGPCEAPGDALLDGSRVLRWAQPGVASDPTAPDADGRVPAVVLFEDGFDRTQVLRDRGFKVDRYIPLVNGVSLRATEAELLALQNEPHVAHVQKSYVFRSATLYRPRLIGPAVLTQTAEEPPPAELPTEITWGLRTVQAPDVWDPTGSGEVDPDAPAGQGIKVCVLDSGVDMQHPEIQAMYGGGWDFIDNDDNPDDSTPLLRNSPIADIGGGHGTHVQGTIAARFGHGASTFGWMHEGGVVGVAPRAEVITGRVLGTEGNGSLEGIVNGINWCVEQDARIINLSLGSRYEDPAQRRAITAAVEQDVLLVAAAGNDGSDEKHYPAAFPGVMAVAAVQEDGTRGSFSQRGAHISVGAPGVNVLSSTIRGSGYYTRLSVDDVELSQTAHAIVSGSGSGEYGGTIVDCGTSTSYESCAEGATCGGFVALVQRGGATFGEKVKYARGQGAKMVIIYDPDPASPAGEAGLYTLGDIPTDIPVFSVSREVGEALLAGTSEVVQAGVYLTDYDLATGTSMASPHVAGVAALVWSAKPSMTAAQVRQVIECSAEYIGSNPAARPNIGTGYGMVKSQDALDLLAQWDASGWPATGSCE